MLRIISQKLYNLIALYEAKGLKAVLRTSALKIVYLLGFKQTQEIAFNLFMWKKYKNIKQKLSRYENKATLWSEFIKISIFLIIFDENLPDIQQTVKTIKHQIFKNLEILCAFDSSHLNKETQDYLHELSHSDSRFTLHSLSVKAQNSDHLNRLLSQSSGDFICLVNAGDQLSIDACYEVAQLLNEKPDADFIYSDDAQLSSGNWLTYPFFKPDWSPDTLLSRMYTGRLSIFRRSLVQQIGGWRPDYGDAQEYDLVLRLTEQTHRIFHIPKVLYFWKQDNSPEKDLRSYLKKRFCITALSTKAVEETLVRRQEPGNVLLGESASFTVRYHIKAHHRVSIIIPTRDLWEILDRCLDSLFTKSSYPDFEIILVDNGSKEKKTFDVFQKWANQEPNRFFVHRLDIPFNYSELNNFAVSKATGNFLLFLNNDIEIITPDWIEAMVEQAQRPSIGAVGALLLYPDNTIQHAGVVLGLGGAVGGSPGHTFVNLPYGEIGYLDHPNTISNYTALTAACLMCRRHIFDEVKGFEEELAVAFNDTDFCLKIHRKGYRNIYLPHVKLYHHESKSRGRSNTPEKKRQLAEELSYLQTKWQDLIDHDPAYNPNLTQERSDFSFDMTKLFAKIDD